MYAAHTDTDTMACMLSAYLQIQIHTIYTHIHTTGYGGGGGGGGRFGGPPGGGGGQFI
jgi:hypothetical protein